MIIVSFAKAIANPNTDLVTGRTAIDNIKLRSILCNSAKIRSFILSSDALLVIMKKAGLGIIDNLSFIFAAGMALGMAKRERAVTVLSSVIAFFVMYALINVLLVINGQILADNSIVIMF